MTYGDLAKRKASGKVLRDLRAFNIAKNLKYDGCQKGLAPYGLQIFL